MCTQSLEHTEHRSLPGLGVPAATEGRDSPGRGSRTPGPAGASGAASGSRGRAGGLGPGTAEPIFALCTARAQEQTPGSERLHVNSKKWVK